MRMQCRAASPRSRPRTSACLADALPAVHFVFKSFAKLTPEVVNELEAFLSDVAAQRTSQLLKTLPLFDLLCLSSSTAPQARLSLQLQPSLPLREEDSRDNSRLEASSRPPSPAAGGGAGVVAVPVAMRRWPWVQRHVQRQRQLSSAPAAAPVPTRTGSIANGSTVNGTRTYAYDVQKHSSPACRPSLLQGVFSRISFLKKLIFSMMEATRGPIENSIAWRSSSERSSKKTHEP